MRVSYLTLYERSVLALTQNRKSPNKVRLIGLIQPLIDGLKLLIKEILLRHEIFLRGFFMFTILIFFNIIVG